MKLEIEITEDEIKDALARHIRTAIADQVNQWGSKNYITQEVKKAWSEQVVKTIEEQLADSETIKEQVREAIENKLRGQITTLMRNKK